MTGVRRTLHLATICMSLVVLAVLAPLQTRAMARSSFASLPVLREQYFGPPWIPTLDPAMATDSPSIDLIYMVQANLVKYLPNGTPIPDLATWKISKDHLFYTFTIRKGAVFSNGDPVTAQDVKFSLTRALAKSTVSPVASLYLGHIWGAPALEAGKTNTLKGVKVLNSRQVQIRVDKPIAFFLAQLTYPTAQVLDPKFVQGKKPGTYLTNTCSANVGAGPFMFVCRNGSTDKSSFYPSGQSPTMTLVPNPRYYGRKAHIKVVLSQFANTATQFRAFQAGQVDVTGVPTPDIQRVQNQPGFIKYPTSVIDFITPDEDLPPFNNVHCRLALAYAIDRDTINNKLLHHAQFSVYDVLPKGMLGYYDGANNPHYNPTRAKAELKQCSGGIHGVAIKLPNNSTDLTNEYTAITSMWKAVGIDVSLKTLTLDDYIQVWSQHLTSTHTLLAWNNWGEDYNDPQDYCTLLLHSGQPRNLGDFKNPTYDRLVDQAEVTFNTEKRAALYRQAQHIAVSLGAWIPVGQQNGYTLFKPYVHGFVGSPLGLVFPKGMDWANITITPH